jgi:enoyl-CoA hydratase/carnithine racemase
MAGGFDVGEGGSLRSGGEAHMQRSDDDGVVILAVPNPARPGAEAQRLARTLVDACEEIETNEAQPVAVILTCPAPAFCIFPPTSAADCDALGDDWARATAALARLAPPTIAVIAGDAIGPAWELALACDFRLVGPEARVGSPEVAFGRMPAAGGTQRLARLVGRSGALRMLLLGEIVGATDALAQGLVHRVGSPTVETPLAELLAALRGSAPIALAYTKEAIRAADDLTLEAGLRLEADLAALLQTTTDRAEGVAAALARRPPAFRGR